MDVAGGRARDGPPRQRTMVAWVSLEGAPWLPALIAGQERFGFDRSDSYRAQEAILMALREFWAAVQDERVEAESKRLPTPPHGA